MGADKMVQTKWYGQNGIRTKCHWTKWNGQNGTNKTVPIKSSINLSIPLPLSFFCVCYAPDLVGALTGIRVNSVSRWHHWFPRRYSQEGRPRVNPGFVNADAILPSMTSKGPYANLLNE